MWKISAFLLIATTSAVVLPGNRNTSALTGQALIDYVNSAQKLWTAGHQVIPKEEVMKRVMNVKYVAPNKEEDIVAIEVADWIPDHFDAREQWPNCRSISNVRDQSTCGACWAFAAAEAISDRTCIASNGRISTLLSSEDVLSCCTESYDCGDGCEGGFPLRAWQWWVKNGLVTGGSYESQFGCKPYSIAPCGKTINGHTWPPCETDNSPTPDCVEECTSDIPYPISYFQDKHFGATAYGIGSQVEQIQTEIMRNGPIEVGFTIYEDLYHYHSGIYRHTAGSYRGGHTLKIIGWGVENGIPYWLGVNSWSIIWGENGYIRFIRGINECGIEQGAVAGIPDLNRHN